MTALRNAWSDESVRVRAALCDAALSLLVDHGIAAFDIDEVDGRADLPPGTCRQHFHSQGALLAALLERTANMYHDELEELRHRHPDDVVRCIVDWLSFVVGPARDRSQVVWALLLDPGTRAQIAMYADALQMSWEGRVSGLLGLPVDHVRVAWALVEGWIGRNLMHQLPVPSHDALASHIGALLGVPRAGGPDADSATVGR